MDPTIRKSNLAEFLAGKEALRESLRKLSFADKIRLVIRMQEMERAFKGAKGKKVHVWRID